MYLIIVKEYEIINHQLFENDLVMFVDNQIITSCECA